VVCSARRFCEICDGTRDHSVMTTLRRAVAGISAWHFEHYGAGSWLDVQIYPLGAFANVWTAAVRLVIRCSLFRPIPMKPTRLPWRAITEILRWEFLINPIEKIQVFFIPWQELQTIYMELIYLYDSMSPNTDSSGCEA